MATIEKGVKLHGEETELKARNGMACMVVNILATIALIAAFVLGVLMVAQESSATPLAVVLIVVGALYGFFVGPVIFVGLKVLKPNEAYVLTLFGRY